jgi:tol-pal system protein YbgF
MNLGNAPAQPKIGASGPGNLGTLPASQAPALATAPAVGTPDDQYNAALNLLSTQQYGEAQTAFRSFAAANPKHKLAGTAQFFAADIDFVQKNYPAAAQGFTAVLRGYPSSPRAPDAMLKLGLSLLQAGDKKNGCLTLGAIKQKYPSANGEILNRAGRARLQGGC